MVASVSAHGRTVRLPRASCTSPACANDRIGTKIEKIVSELTYSRSVIRAQYFERTSGKGAGAITTADLVQHDDRAQRVVCYRRRHRQRSAQHGSSVASAGFAHVSPAKNDRDGSEPSVARAGRRGGERAAVHRETAAGALVLRPAGEWAGAAAARCRVGW